MKKIRFGKDIAFCWAITTNGEQVPLEGRDLKVILSAVCGGKKVELPYTCDGCVLRFKYYGKDHIAHGVYNVTLWENYGKIGQTVVDKMKAFELVSNTEQEN